MIERCPGLSITRLKSGPLGGDQQVGALIAEGRIDALVFFVDPLSPHPHDVDVKALTRLALVYDIPLALNRATAERLIGDAPAQARLRFPRGFARRVGSALSGSSGQGCFGYWPRMSARTAAQEPRQKPGRSRVIWIGRCAGERRWSTSGTRPAAIVGCWRSPNSSCTRTARTGPSSAP